MSRAGRAALWLAWSLAALVIAVVLAEPIADGDPFWHMAYAREMLAYATPYVDHRTFSWTPADNTHIYCAWLAELVLYGLWTGLGPWSLFAMRYAIAAAVVALAWRFARRAGLGGSILVPALAAIVVLASRAGTLLKPELFSFALFHLVLWLYFRAKIARVAGESPALPLWWIAFVLVVWVNVHGAFVFVGAMLVAVTIGEALNARWMPVLALHRGSWWQWAAGLAACGIAVAVNPYGIAYPLDILAFVRDAPDAYYAANIAHLGLFHPLAASLHFVEYGTLLLGAVVVTAIASARFGRPGARADFAVLLLHVVYGALFIGQLRTTYLWPAVALYSTIYFARLALPSAALVRDWWRDAGPARAASAAALALLALVGGRAVYEARYAPHDGTWLGFGIGDVNPVAESEFLAASGLHGRLYNLFNSGGYLLWRMYPTFPVMVDQRGFPYLSWLDDQQKFTSGAIFDDFLRKYPADIAVIEFASERCADNFLASPDWRLVYYGPSAAVFVRQSVTVPAQARDVLPHRFDDLRNPATAFRVFRFAAQAGDYAVAWRALDQLAGRHAASVNPANLRAALQYRDAHRAVARGDYVAAARLFAGIGEASVQSAADRNIRKGLYEWSQPEVQSDAARRAALERRLAEWAVRE